MYAKRRIYFSFTGNVECLAQKIDYFIEGMVNGWRTKPCSQVPVKERARARKRERKRENKKSIKAVRTLTTLPVHYSACNLLHFPAYGAPIEQRKKKTHNVNSKRCRMKVVHYNVAAIRCILSIVRNCWEKKVQCKEMQSNN